MLSWTAKSAAGNVLMCFHVFFNKVHPDASTPEGQSQVRITGIRSWISSIRLLAPVVMMQVVTNRLQSLLVSEAVVRYWCPAQGPRSNTKREIRL